MPPMNISRITENLQKLPADKLAVVHDFVSYLTERETKRQDQVSKAPAVVLLSEVEYEQLLRCKRSYDFFEFTRDLGQQVENSGLAEQDLMNELEETKREVFAERYGELK